MEIISQKKQNPNVKNNKKRNLWIIFSIIFGIAIGAASYVIYKQYFANSNFSIPSVSIKKPTPQPATTVNPLDGTLTSKDLANRHPLAVIVENHPDARPQAGLDKASIIYEAIAEGGITRFMAIYSPEEALKIGPVRSVRTYFLDWAAEYNAFIAHVGGNIDALDRIDQEKPYNLDEFGVGDKAFWREPISGIAIEHTMFTSSQKLYQVAKNNNWPETGDFTAFKFFDPEKFKTQNVSQEITIDFSSAEYKVKYTYDNLKNDYPRQLAGVAHKDRITGNQLAPTNIIIQSVDRWESPTRINEQGWAMQTIGEGKAYVIYGGQKIDATWKKTDLKSRTKFFDSNGEEISFLPGQFWYEIVPPDVFDKITIQTSTPEPVQ